MPLATLKKVMARISPTIAASIYAELSAQIETLDSGPSAIQLDRIISELDTVSNKSGLHIVGMTMWPDDEMTELMQGLSDKIVANCGAIDRVEPSNA